MSDDLFYFCKLFLNAFIYLPFVGCRLNDTERTAFDGGACCFDRLFIKLRLCLF